MDGITLVIRLACITIQLMAALSLDAWISILVTVTVVGVLQFRRAAPVDLLFLGGLIVVTLKGIITPLSPESFEYNHPG